jgi:hypothetical protein
LEHMIAVAHRHVEAEASGDLEATMETLEAEPHYELLPTGIAFTGRDAARTYYEHFFSTFRATAVRSEVRGEYVSDDGLVQEYVIEVRGPGGTRERFPVVSVLSFGAQALSGERIYAEDRFLRMLFGPAYLLGRP